MKYNYLIFVLIGIILFLLWNNYNTFSIGNQLRIHNKPCSCSDEFNMTFQDEDSCLYIDDEESARRERRHERYDLPCTWTGNSDLVTTIQRHTLTSLYKSDTAQRFRHCRAQYTNGAMCMLINGIEYFCYLVGVPVDDSDIVYMVELNIGIESTRTAKPAVVEAGAATEEVHEVQMKKVRESLCKIFLKSEGVSILKQYELMPHITSNQQFTNLSVEKYYRCRWFARELYAAADHQLTIYYFRENDRHKIVILDIYWAPAFFLYGLDNVILVMDDLNDAPMKIIVFYLKCKPFLLLSNGIIFMGNGESSDAGILCIVTSYDEISVTSDSSLESQELLKLARHTKFKVNKRLDIGNTIRMRVISYFRGMNKLLIDGWVTLTVDSSDAFKFIPDDLFTSSNYDASCYELAGSSTVFFEEFISCKKIYEDNMKLKINYSYMDGALLIDGSLEHNRGEYFRVGKHITPNPLIQTNDNVMFEIQENALLLSLQGTLHSKNYIKVYFGDFALSNFTCDSFRIPGSFLPMSNNHITIQISRYTYMIFKREGEYDRNGEMRVDDVISAVGHMTNGNYGASSLSIRINIFKYLD